MTFQGKVRARMTSALKQSGGVWLPVLHPEASVGAAIAAAPDGPRVVLESSGAAMTGISLVAGTSIAVGPEGGLEPDELEQLTAAGFQPASLGPATLRFETAAVVALGIARSALAAAER